MLDDFLSDSLHFPRQIDGASDLFRNPRFFAACAVEHVKGPPRMRLKHACNELGLRAAPMTDGATRLGALFVHAGSESQHGLAGKLKSPYQLAGCNPGDDIQSLMLPFLSAGLGASYLRAPCREVGPWLHFLPSEPFGRSPSEDVCLTLFLRCCMEYLPAPSWIINGRTRTGFHINPPRRSMNRA
jgi:hypothetical protein